MTKRIVITCKVIDQENWNTEKIGKTFELINPFGCHGTNNDPKDVMVLKWLVPAGSTYVFNHAYGESYDEEKDNTVSISATCGQKATFELDNIDKSQEISEVTIRGVTYVPK